MRKKPKTQSKKQLDFYESAAASPGQIYQPESKSRPELISELSRWILAVALVVGLVLLIIFIYQLQR